MLPHQITTQGKNIYKRIFNNSSPKKNTHIQNRERERERESYPSVDTHYNPPNYPLVYPMFSQLSHIFLFDMFFHSHIHTPTHIHVCVCIYLCHPVLLVCTENLQLVWIWFLVFLVSFFYCCFFVFVTSHLSVAAIYEHLGKTLQTKIFTIQQHMYQKGFLTLKFVLNG